MFKEIQGRARSAATLGVASALLVGAAAGELAAGAAAGL